MGRQRKRDRLARASEALPSHGGAPAAHGSAPDATASRRLGDKEWRRAERRRIARLNRLPDPFRSWADRSRAHAAAVGLLQGLVAIAISLAVLRLVTGVWLPTYAAVVVLAVAVGLQAVCRSVNRRADERAARA